MQEISANSHGKGRFILLNSNFSDVKLEFCNSNLWSTNVHKARDHPCELVCETTLLRFPLESQFMVHQERVKLVVIVLCLFSLLG